MVPWLSWAPQLILNTFYTYSIFIYDGILRVHPSDAEKQCHCERLRSRYTLSFFLKTNFYWWASLLLLLLLVLVVVIILHQSPIHQNPTCERFVVDCPESLVVLVVVLLLVLIAILTQFRIARKTVSTEAGLSRSGWPMDIPVEDCLDCFNWGGHTQSTGGSSIPWVWAFNCLSSGGIINISKYTHVHCHSTPGCLR